MIQIIRRLKFNLKRTNGIDGYIFIFLMCMRIVADRKRRRMKTNGIRKSVTQKNV